MWLMAVTFAAHAAGVTQAVNPAGAGLSVARTSQPAAQQSAPPAGYAGSDTCVLCHEDKETSLKGTPHAQANNLHYGYDNWLYGCVGYRYDLVRAAQQLAGVATTALIYFLAAEYFSPAAAFAAGMIAALYGPLAFYEVTFLTTTLAVLATALSLWLLARATRRPPLSATANRCLLGLDLHAVQAQDLEHLDRLGDDFRSDAIARENRDIHSELVNV
jgi:hypothetical protein